MRTFVLLGALIFAAAAQAEQWAVSERDGYGWRRALIKAGDNRLAVVCPPRSAPFAVPVVKQIAPNGAAGSFTLGLEVDGKRHEQPMVCSKVLCDADLGPDVWRALILGAEVTLWVDDRRGPSFPLDGSADALRACSAHY